jgi:hypothetical protein
LEIHKVAFHYIKKIKAENKSLIQFNLCYNQDDKHWNDLYEDLKANGVNVTIRKYRTHLEDGRLDDSNYYRKCVDTTKTPAPYSVKMDEDIWISNYAWDWIIENIDSIFNMDKSLLAISPIITNGIPTTELFIQNVLSEEEQKTLRDIFYNETIGNWWDVDYSSLAKIRELSSHWDPNIFFDLVRQIPHHYKGVHPVRFSEKAQLLINELAIKHYDKIGNPQEYSTVLIDQPAYLCNTFYFIKTEEWRKILADFSLFRDGMDEVPLNLYRERHNLNFGYLDNVYCVHVLYNSLKNHGVLEQEIIEKYKAIIQ